MVIDQVDKYDGHQCDEDSVADWDKVLILLQRPAPELLHDLDRRAKLMFLEEHARAQRERVLAWLVQEGFGDSFCAVSEATAFGSFTLSCAPLLLSTLRIAPDVVSATPVKDAELDLLSPLVYDDAPASD